MRNLIRSHEPERIISFMGRLVSFTALVLRAIAASYVASAAGVVSASTLPGSGVTTAQFTPFWLAGSECEPMVQSADAMFSMGVLVALMRQVALLHQIPGQSPFLIMLVRFIATLFNLFAVMVLIVVAFTGAFFTL